MIFWVDWFPPFFFGSQNLGSMKVLHLWVGKTTVLRIHRTWHRHIIAQSAERRQALLGRHRTVFSARPERTGTARCQDYVASVSDFLCDVTLIERSSLTTSPHDLRRIDIYIYIVTYFSNLFFGYVKTTGDPLLAGYITGASGLPSFGSSSSTRTLQRPAGKLVLKAARSFNQICSGNPNNKKVCVLPIVL